MSVIFATIVREQTAALEQLLDQTDRYLARPQGIANLPEFATGLCRALAQPDAAAAQRGLLCDSVIEPDATRAPGPLALVPLVATFLRLHLQRRSATLLVQIRATAAGLVLRYTGRTAVDPPPTSWPLLLATLTLRSASWSIVTEAKGQAETVYVRPA